MTVPYSAAKDTLAYQLGTRPLTRMIDFSSVPANEVMAEFKADKLSPVAVKPEVDALWFYLMNHAVARVRELKDMNEPLGEFEWVLKEYHRQCADRAVRAYRYLMLIVTREARHGGPQMDSDGYAKLAKKIGHEGKVATQYVKQKICNAGGGEDGAIGNLQTSPPACGIGPYVQAIRGLFYDGAWGQSSTVSYGGKKWGAVTDCLMEYVYGRYSAEMMLDTVWTLCHNGGPIFNKGMQYEHYNGEKLKMILDVQRSGQIPQLILAPEGWVNGYVSGELQAMAKKIVTTIPGVADTGKLYVDWFKVKALGGIHGWATHQQQQLAKYGQPDASAYSAKMSADMKAKAEAAEKAAIEKAKLAAQKLAEKANGWEVMPGLTLQKFKPEREAL